MSLQTNRVGALKSHFYFYSSGQWGVGGGGCSLLCPWLRYWL